MAPALRTAFFATSLFAAAEEEDGTSLLQAVSVKGINRGDKKSVSNLLETAGSMLKNGATEDVVEFAQATLEEITGVVVPAIADASEVDQGLLNSMYAEFEIALAELEEGNQRIHELNAERVALSAQHKQCRNDEAVKCHDKQQCDYHLWELWKTFVEEETEMRDIEGDINGHFCVQDEDGWYIANGTTYSFRAQSVPYMVSFIEQKVLVERAEEHYDDHNPFCQNNYTVLDDKTAQCDALQLALERSACALAMQIRDVQISFAAAWNLALWNYDLTVAEVKLQEIDRISEYRTLSVVQCLLDRVHERNGRPCDETTDEAVIEITHCEEVRVTTDITWLQLTYHIVEAHPLPCPDRHQVVGRCYPELTHGPCGAEYLNEEYGSLPEVPMPEFSETNSHCNPRPDCESCEELADEPVINLCSAMAALVRYELCADTTVTSGPITITNAPVTEPPAPVCGALPLLTNAAWNPTDDGLLWYHCEEGFSFNGFLKMEESREVECLENGAYSPVYACLPIDDCPGHACGAFGTCVDLHMDYTCRCQSGYEVHTSDAGEKMCGNIDDCGGNQCGEAGVCVDLVNDHECQCEDGWSQMIVDGAKTCERVECGPVPVVMNVMEIVDSGNFPWTRGKAVFEETVDYTCALGHTTNGQLGADRIFTIQCQANGNYTTPGQCLPISCGVPEPIGSATPNSNGALLFEQDVEYSCPAGHGPDVFMRVCMDTGDLSAAIACEPKLCGVAPSVPMASLRNGETEGLYFFGQTAQYACDDGYSTDVSEPRMRQLEVECLADGWGSATETCEPITCEVEPHESHAAFELFTIEYDSFNVMLCADGHTHDGSAHGATEISAVCTKTGAAVVPPCHPVQCLGSGLEQTLNADLGELRDYVLGEVAMYTCAEGHEVADTGASSFQVECLRSGMFSAMSTCRNIDDCEGHACGSNGRCVDGIGDYSCDCDFGFEVTMSDEGEQMCGNIDDCGPGACGSNGACHDLVGGFMCECQDGYELQGEGDSQVCTAKTCEFPAWEHVTTPTIGLKFPQTIFVECFGGYSLGARADFQVECGADGVITSGGSLDLPQCMPVVCGAAPHVFAEVVQDRVDWHFGETAVSTCRGGQVEITHECGADGNWVATSEYTTCQQRCRQVNRQAVANSHRADAGRVLHPEGAHFACDEGYRAAGNSDSSATYELACEADGTWGEFTATNGQNTDGFTCVPIECERPDAPENMEWVTDGSFNTQTPHYLRCVVGCERPISGSTGAASQREVRCLGADGHSRVPEPCVVTTFSLSGRVRSALPPQAGISGATLEINGQTITANARGRFNLELPTGTFEYTLRAEGFITLTGGSVTVTRDSNGFDLNMSPMLDEDSYRIVLTWNELPFDLDSHLVFHGERETGAWSCPQMFYGRQLSRCSGVEATLDVDDRFSFGPETTTLAHTTKCSQLTSYCRWVYKVKNFSGYWMWDPDTWADSQAVVQLYNNDRLLGTFRVQDLLDGNGAHGHVESDGAGCRDCFEDSYYDWSVFAIDADGTVTPCANTDCNPV